MSTRNKLGDLHDHLFAQVERLSDEALDDEALDREVKRTDALVAISSQIIGANRLGLDARKAAAIHGWKPTSTPALTAGNAESEPRPARQD